MDLKSELEVANTRGKLRSLQETYEQTRNDASLNERVRESSLRSLKRLINQLTEEIARYETGASNGGRQNRMLQNEHEVAATREKLRRLEESYEEAKHRVGDSQEMREAELASFKRLINQFTEEIARYEAKQATAS